MLMSVTVPSSWNAPAGRSSPDTPREDKPSERRAADVESAPPIRPVQRILPTHRIVPTGTLIGAAARAADADAVFAALMEEERAALRPVSEPAEAEAAPTEDAVRP